jgi:DNA-binding NarL/FixJ family response regulator
LNAASITFYISAVATILLCGVDLFMRGKLEALLPGHRLITVDHTEDPELVLADVSRVDPDEVADTYPDIPIVGFTNHTDTSGLRAAHTAGFDQVLAKSALGDQLGAAVEELAGPAEP